MNVQRQKHELLTLNFLSHSLPLSIHFPLALKKRDFPFRCSVSTFSPMKIICLIGTQDICIKGYRATKLD